MNNFVKFRLWCLIGLTLSCYASYVELRREQDKSYVALCDVSPRVSCTTVFSSIYGKGFGLMQYISRYSPPNGVIGMVFYVLLLLSTFVRQRPIFIIQLLLCFLANVLSIYLVYLLYFVLEDLCLVCVSIYVVNYICFRESWRMYTELFGEPRTKILFFCKRQNQD